MAAQQIVDREMTVTRLEKEVSDVKLYIYTSVNHSTMCRAREIYRISIVSAV